MGDKLPVKEREKLSFVYWQVYIVVLLIKKEYFNTKNYHARTSNYNTIRIIFINVSMNPSY